MYHFVGADLYLRYVQVFRVALYSGRYGGGKTLLAVATADYFRRKYGYSVYSNIPVSGAVTTLQERQVLILDEAWLEFSEQSTKTLREWFAYTRKRDQIILLTSVLPLAGKFFQLRVQRWFNGMSVGLPFAIYQWFLPSMSARGRRRLDSGLFALFGVRSVWSLYDHTAEPRTLRMWELSNDDQ